MPDEANPSIEDERDNVFMARSHLVILGAGASRAAFPEGDRHAKKLPLMSDFVDTLGLRAMLVEWGIDPDRNFEDIFSDIFEAGETARIDKLQRQIREYFASLKIGA